MVDRNRIHKVEGIQSCKTRDGAPNQPSITFRSDNSDIN